jgi:RNA polymerase sigma-70 factor (ECF subfamily)
MNSLDFTNIYQTYFDDIYRFVYYKVYQTEDAEDLTSLVFQKVYMALDKFDSKKASLKTWIYTIARNTVIDFYRKNYETNNIDEFLNLSSKEDLEEDAKNKIMLENIKSYLEKLNPEQREIVILRVWEDKPFQEIAEIMGKKEGAVKMSFKRSILKIKKAFSTILLYFLNLII